jgi:hypothetical protein
MGSILINIPDISVAELMFNQMETQQILKFFWPLETAQIQQMKITDDVRRLAQTALIAGIDGTYAMGFMKGTLESVVNPGKSLASFGQKLARSFMRNWWKHATIKNLNEAKVAESVRKAIANTLRPFLDDATRGASLKGTGIIFSYRTLIQSIRA